MKNLKFIFLSLLFFSAFIACEKEPGIQIKSDPTPPSITLPANGQAYNFTAKNATDSLYVNWQHADYGFTAIYSYTVQIDKQGNAFAKPAKVGASETNSLGTTVDKFNTAVKKLKYKAGEEAVLDMRIVSTISPLVDDLTSNVITVKFVVY
jgi:starch-binding outer membrane protein SusE/F